VLERLDALGCRSTWPGNGYGMSEQEHDCQPPTHDRSIDDNEWRCPVCGQRWRIESTEIADESGTYTFDRTKRDAGLNQAHWVRVDT